MPPLLLDVVDLVRVPGRLLAGAIRNRRAGPVHGLAGLEDVRPAPPDTRRTVTVGGYEWSALWTPRERLVRVDQAAMLNGLLLLGAVTIAFTLVLLTTWASGAQPGPGTRSILATLAVVLVLANVIALFALAAMNDPHPDSRAYLLRRLRAELGAADHELFELDLVPDQPSPAVDVGAGVDGATPQPAAQPAQHPGWPPAGVRPPSTTRVGRPWTTPSPAGMPRSSDGQPTGPTPWSPRLPKPGSATVGSRPKRLPRPATPG